MKVECDHCNRTANGSKTELVDEGWCKIIVSSPFRRTFIGCPEHARIAVATALAAIEEAGGRIR